MNAQFWHQRWQRGELGWHDDGFNRHLAEYWPSLSLPAQTRVFVPLCGKSLDMVWLASRGYRVLGVEISAVGVDAFCDENGLTPGIADGPPFQRYTMYEIEILVGDFFDLRPAHLQGVGAVYDRASLIALPPAMRPRYARHLAALLPPDVESLLITLEYDSDRMSGPPFAVASAEVHALFAAAFEVELLATFDVLAESRRFRERGLNWLNEQVYRLRRLPN
ncbi:MAG: thiopurine S-methyltransferase [Thiohalocapsa sp.]